MAANQHPRYDIIACIILVWTLDLSELQVIRVYSSVLFFTVIGGQDSVTVIGIFVHDLIVTGNSVAEISEVRERMK